MAEQLIKKYHSYAGQAAAVREFQRDAKKLAKEGWKVVSAVPTQYNGIIMRRQGMVVVTYSKE